MAHSEACQLFIEERIQEGLAAGKTPHSIGKELTAVIKKYFEASIPAESIRSRARRMKKSGTGQMTSPPTTATNHLESQEKRHNQVLTDDKGQFKKGTAPGPGRPPKYVEPEPYSCALQMATIAISQLSRIRRGDPKRQEAFQEVMNWINDNW